jgi:uncharacterized protein (DUF4415 family)
MRKPIKQLPSRGRADFERMDSMTEEEIMRTSPPELANLPDDFFENAVLVMPGPKVAISIRIDEDVLEWFRATGSLYQKRMNAVLRTYMSAQLRAKKTHVSKVSEPRAGSARGSSPRKRR